MTTVFTKTPASQIFFHLHCKFYETYVGVKLLSQWEKSAKERCRAKYLPGTQRGSKFRFSFFFKLSQLNSSPFTIGV